MAMICSRVASAGIYGRNIYFRVTQATGVCAAGSVLCVVMSCVCVLCVMCVCTQLGSATQARPVPHFVNTTSV